MISDPGFQFAEDRSELAEEDLVLLKITELNAHIGTIEEEIKEMKKEDPRVGVEGSNQKLTKFFNLLTHIYEQKLQALVLKEETANPVYKERMELTKKKEEALDLNVSNFKELEILIETFHPTTFVKDENWFDYDLSHYTRLLNQEAEKGRKDGNTSFMELVNYKPLWASARLLGTKLSQLLIDFLMLCHFHTWVRPLIWRVQVTLENLRMEEKSVIINTFLEVLREVDQEYSKLPWDGQYRIRLDRGRTLLRRELGIAILQAVLYLEYCFCCPLLPVMELSTGTLDAFANYLEARVNQKEKILGITINEMKKDYVVPPEDRSCGSIFKSKLYEITGKVWAKVKEP